MQVKALTWYIKQVLNVCARMYPRIIHRDVLYKHGAIYRRWTGRVASGVCGNLVM
jgi:hypothetical protein